MTETTYELFGNKLNEHQFVIVRHQPGAAERRWVLKCGNKEAAETFRDCLVEGYLEQDALFCCWCNGLVVRITQGA